MSMATLERAILDELKEVSKNFKFKQKDIMEWSTGKDSVKVEAGEKYYYLPKLGVSVAVKQGAKP